MHNYRNQQLKSLTVELGGTVFDMRKKSSVQCCKELLLGKTQISGCWHRVLPQAAKLTTPTLHGYLRFSVSLCLCLYV